GPSLRLSRAGTERRVRPFLLWPRRQGRRQRRRRRHQPELTHFRFPDFFTGVPMKANFRQTTCGLAVAAAFAAMAPLDASAAGFTTGGTVFTTATPAVALPAPTSGTLEVWFKKPVSGATVSGQVQLDGCYLAGRGRGQVDFFLDS